MLPQTLVLHLPCPMWLSHLTLTTHEYLTPEAVEVLVGPPPTTLPCLQAPPGSASLGVVRFSSGAPTHFRSRETKVVALNCVGAVVVCVVHSLHHTLRNAGCQVRGGAPIVMWATGHAWDAGGRDGL
jgi:hypothetical protein